MENENQIETFKNLIWVIILSSVLLTLFASIGIGYGIIIEENPFWLILLLAALIVILISLFIVLLWIYNLRLKQLLKYHNIAIENDKKRNHEKAQADLNHQYRVEALKFETLHQTVKELRKKDETDKNKDIKTEEAINVLLNATLLDAIKKLKNEFDKI